MAIFKEIDEQLVHELAFDAGEIVSNRNKWIKEHGDSEKSLCKFYRETLKIAEKYYSGKNIPDKTRHEKLRTIYLAMFRVHIEAGWSRTSVTRKLNNLNMLEASQSRVKMKMAIIPPGRCQYGEGFREYMFDLEMALKEFPLDYSKCEREGGCVCTVGFQGVRDEDGRLVMKEG